MFLTGISQGDLPMSSNTWQSTGNERNPRDGVGGQGGRRNHRVLMQREKDTESISIYFNHLADARFHCSKRRQYLSLQCIPNLVVNLRTRSLSLQDLWQPPACLMTFTIEFKSSRCWFHKELSLWKLRMVFDLYYMGVSKNMGWVSQNGCVSFLWKTLLNMGWFGGKTQYFRKYPYILVWNLSLF